MFSIWIQKSIFLKSGQLITGLSKAWIGTQNEVLSIPNNTATGQLSTYTITHTRFNIPQVNETSSNYFYYNPTTIVDHSTEYIADLLYFPIITLRTTVSAFTTTSTKWQSGNVQISIRGTGDNTSVSYYYKSHSMSTMVQFDSDTEDKIYYYISKTTYNPDYSNINSGSWFKPKDILKQYDNMQVGIYYNGNSATFSHTAIQVDVFILGCNYT